MNLLKDLQAYIIRENLFVKQDKILVAVSGGVDSVALLHLLHLLGYEIGVVHCHFALRVEADKEAELVRNLAEKLQVPFYFQKFETARFAQTEGISIQMAARRLRYDFFEQIRQQEHYKYIATAHHLNDSLETAIFNFSKGTGIAGLRGILPKNGFIVRPLLFASKAEIMQYAQKQGWQWLEDSSNASCDYTRNFIRHNILPLLEQINPNILQNFSETAQRLLSTEKIWQNKLQEIQQKYIQEQGEICQICFSDEIDVVILHHFLEKWGFSFRQCQDIYESKQVGAEFFSQTHWLVRDRKAWIIVPISFYQDENSSFELIENNILKTKYFELQSKTFENSNFIAKNEPNEAYFDAEKLEFPLCVRVWRMGDRFQPLGMKGKKKISDFLVDCKIPKNLKKRIFVVESGKEIIYVAGLRSSEYAKVSPETQKICKLTFRFI
ncbi:tRNA lysidine(34) synthetase TilS [Raineya sp.]|jgi:tRNA(Ile)-lysidine synthase